jgi:hypothetical protein
MKGDGRVRICSEYKITLNRAARLEKYPILQIEELFASLAGGKSFTKLDFSHDLQIPLDEESCHLWRGSKVSASSTTSSSRVLPRRNI